MNSINNFIIVISAPSGAGKTTIAEIILKKMRNIKKTVSRTSREIRRGEINGVDYFFHSKEEMLKMISHSLFVESTEIYENYYGTLKSEIDDILNVGMNPLLIIDWVGLSKLKIVYASLCKIISFFILPPSISELELRLIKRGDDFNSIQRRLREAENDIQKSFEYDYKIVNFNAEVVALSIMKNIEIQFNL